MKKKRQHKGAVASARQRFLRDKLAKGKISQSEYKLASNGKRK